MVWLLWNTLLWIVQISIQDPTFTLFSNCTRSGCSCRESLHSRRSNISWIRLAVKCKSFHLPSSEASPRYIVAGWCPSSLSSQVLLLLWNSNPPNVFSSGLLDSVRLCLFLIKCNVKNKIFSPIPSSPMVERSKEWNVQCSDSVLLKGVWLEFGCHDSLHLWSH